MTDHNEGPSETERKDPGTTQTNAAGASKPVPPPTPNNEYEPNDSRNVTGTAKTEDGRWTNDKKDLAPGDN